MHLGRKILPAYFVVKNGYVTIRTSCRLFCVCNGESGSFLVAVCIVSQGRETSRSLNPTAGSGAVSRYTYPRSRLSSLSFSLSFFLVYSCIRMIRCGSRRKRVRREEPTEALYERGGHRAPSVPTPLMFDSCVWAMAGRRRRSVREECEDA